MKTNKNTPLRGLTVLFLIVVGIGWLSGCQSDDFVEATPPANGEDVRLTFRVSDASNPGTYLPGDFSDKVFDRDLVALIFKQDGEDLRYDRFRKVTTKDGVRSIFLPSSLIGHEFTMVLCANATDILTDNPDSILVDENPPNGAQPIGRTYQELINKIGQFAPDCKAANFALPMWAKIDNITVPANNPSYNLGTGILLRSLCRVDVGINYPDAGTLGDVAEGLLTKFTLEKVHIARSVDKAQLIPSTDNWTLNGDEYKITAPSVPNDKKKVDWIEFTPNLAGKSCQEMIYLPEQENKDLADDKLRPCVILEGTYKFSASETKGFYRVDFINTEIAGKPQVDLLRGHLIRFNITDVKGPGYKNRDEALNSKPMNIEVKLADYTIFNSNTIFDGQYHFTLNKKEVTMPRDGDVSYALSVNTNIPVGEWKMRLDVNGSGVWSEASAIENGHFSVTKAQKEGDNHTLTIKTIRPWDSDPAKAYLNEAKLQIEAKRLKIEIPLHQIDQSVADWEVGNVTDDKLEGSVLSKTSFFFSGIEQKDKLEIYSGGSATEYKISFETPEGGPMTAPWLTIKQQQGQQIPIFDVSVVLNSDDVIRRTIAVLEEDGAPEGTEPLRILVTQNPLPYGDLLDENNGVLWRSRNIGAATSLLDDGDFLNNPTYIYINKGNSICPVGWVVPNRQDYRAIVQNLWPDDTDLYGYKNASFKYQYVVRKGGGDYLMFYPTTTTTTTTTKLVFQPRNRDATIPWMYYWFISEPFTGGDSHGALRMSFSEWDGRLTVSQNLEVNFSSHVRCVRKLTLDRLNVQLGANGNPQTVNLTTIETGEPITVEFEDPEDERSRGFFVRRDSPTRLSVGCTKPNLTGKDITNVRVKIRGTKIPRVSRPLIISQKTGSTLVNDAHPFVTIGSTDWYGKNIGATSFDNGYLHYKIVKSTNESVDYGGRDYDNVLNAPANIVAKNEGAFGGTFLQGNGLAKCRALGTEWRLPSPFEWSELLAHTRILEGDLTKIAGGNGGVLHNETEYPIYVVDDGKNMMYLPLGKAPTGLNADVRSSMSVRAVSYHTSVGIGGSYTHVHLSRYLYGENKDNKSRYTYIRPWGGNATDHYTYDATHLASVVNYVTVIGYIRCVRNTPETEKKQ